MFFIVFKHITYRPLPLPSSVAISHQFLISRDSYHPQPHLLTYLPTKSICIFQHTPVGTSRPHTTITYLSIAALPCTYKSILTHAYMCMYIYTGRRLILVFASFVCLESAALVCILAWASHVRTLARQDLTSIYSRHLTHISAAALPT